MRYEEEDRSRGEHHMLSTEGGSWRSHGEKGCTPTPREEDHDHVRDDLAGSSAIYRPFVSPRPRPDRSARRFAAAPARSRSNLSPSMASFHPGNPRQDPSSNDAVPALLRLVQNYARYPIYRVNKAYRSAQPFSTTTSKNSANNLNTPTQGTPSTHRYSLRSMQSNAAPLRKLDETSNHLLHSCQMSPHNAFGSAEMVNELQRQYEHKPTKTRPVSPPPAPTATDLYLAQARLPVVRCATPKKLLVVLDLNGTLLVRPSRARSRDFIIRPGVQQLLDYLFDNHVVMVYSSAQPANVEAMVQELVSKKRAKALAGVWGRDKLGLTPAQYEEKVQVYKKLEKIWEDSRVQATSVNGQLWSQANTVLIDDSHVKALSQPHNLVQVPEFTNKKKLSLEEKRREHEVVASLRAKLEELKWSNDVSRHISRWQTGELASPRATKLSPLPKSPLREIGTGSNHVDNSTPDGVDSFDDVVTQAALEKDMRNLTTAPSTRGEIDRMDQPAISADEWKEFLK